MYAPSQTWNLESLLPGGVAGAAFADILDTTTAQTAALGTRVDAMPGIPDDYAGWREIVLHASDIADQLHLARSVAMLHNSAHTDDPIGRGALGRARDAWQKLWAVLGRIDSQMRDLTDEEIETFASGSLADYLPEVRRTRDAERFKLEPKLQALMTQIDREALHGWGQLYTQITGSLTAEFERDGETRTVSVGQLAALRDAPDADLRRRAFEAKVEAFQPVLDTCATCLTHITGTRQARFDRVGSDALEKCLFSNRVDAAVLDAMWEGSAHVRPALTAYLERKARALGHEALAWHDLTAPLGVSPSDDALSWSDAQTLVVDAFEKLEPDLAAFAKRLLAEGGVESEDRPHKRQGGYCATLPARRTTRIFTTFAGSISGATVLAHELGHAWHAEVLFDAPRPKQHITGSVAESASTFAENIVRDQILAGTTDPARRLFMLDQKLQAGVSMLMNIRARFEFERALYPKRREGPFDAADLNAIMLACQREAYADALGSWHPEMWATKLHFYIPSASFYNWPYTFGFLFSSAIYARARDEGAAFRPVLRELLMRTGWQRVRPMALEVLGEDLTDPDFWARAAAPLLESAAELETLVDGLTAS